MTVWLREWMPERVAIIIGAGPAGLTAAYELLEKTDIKPVVYEMSGDIGGISKTVNYKGNRIDIGGHRFFSKSDRVMAWWQRILPVQGAPARDDAILGRKVPLSAEPGAPDPETTDRVMLIRRRISRIFFLGKFFDYPISLSANTIMNLGPVRLMRIAWTYAKVRISPRKEETSLESFFINRFGEELYRTFFKDYTEKVWGVPCSEIKPEWGAQRVKGLSITKAVLTAAKRLFRRDGSVAQKDVETSLIERFMYPKLGPGHLWEEVARIVEARGGEVHLQHRVVGLHAEGNRMIGVDVRDEHTGETSTVRGDFVLSSMPVRELIASVDAPVPPDVARVAGGLLYRDFVTVGILLRRLKITNHTREQTINDLVPDNWIYIQEKGVKVGRLQILNNWSPYMVKDPGTVWVGAEYFCDEGDEMWSLADDEFARFAIGELEQIGIIDSADVLDSVVARMPKAYPAYFGTFGEFDTVRAFVDRFENLFLIGRNGMHRYNNTDHSMLTAMIAVENIASGRTSKDNLWAVNVEQEYHETR
jgi:protoporphyrinogen oxidase